MISKGTAHNNGARLARYITTAKEGERAELAELRGFASPDIVEAFRSVQAMADGTKIRQPFFHVQVRLAQGETLTSEQWRTTADRIERMLGLTDQPRAIAFHIDERTGDKHMHVAFSRIDGETLKAIPLPFYQLRLKTLSRELEQELGLTLVKNHRDSEIKYAATKDEQQQAQRLGVDKDAIRETIRACWDRSDCGRSFEAALSHEGLILAQGDRRDHLVVDHSGGVHALGKRLLDISAGQVRERLSDLDRTQLPTVNQAREFLFSRELSTVQEQIKAEQEYARRDPVREEAAWLDAVGKAAIEKEKVERKGEPGRETRGQDAQPERDPPVKPEKGIPAEIWTAREHSDSARAFDHALQDRDIVLARATKEDVERQRELAKVAQEYGTRVMTFREGEVVALTQRGEIYRLTERTTGRTWKENQQFTAGLKLESVGDTREILHRAREAERLAAQERAKKARELEQIGNAAKKRGPTRAGMVAQQEWAQDEIKRRSEERRIAEERSRSAEQRRKSEAEHELDPLRFRSDPDYRRYMKAVIAKNKGQEKQPAGEKRPQEPERER